MYIHAGRLAGLGRLELSCFSIHGPKPGFGSFTTSSTIFFVATMPLQIQLVITHCTLKHLPIAVKIRGFCDMCYIM